MRISSRWTLSGSLAAAALSCCAGTAAAAPWNAAPASLRFDPAPIQVSDRWDRDFDDDDYYYPPEYYLPPPPPVVRVVPVPPPAVIYEPPVYGWIAPLRPSNCGKYRYWNGERCADARVDPPYVGPRW